MRLNNWFRMRFLLIVLATGVLLPGFANAKRIRPAPAPAPQPAPAPAPAPIVVAPAPSTAISVTKVSSSISATSITAGQLVTLKYNVLSATTLNNIFIEMRVTNSSGTVVAKKPFENQTLLAGYSTPFQFDFQSSTSLAAGSYMLGIGVWNSVWDTFLYDNYGNLSVATTSVVAPTPTPAPAPEPAPIAAISGEGYPFGSRKTPYIAGIRATNATQAAQDLAVQNLYNSWKKTLYPGCGGYYVKFNTSYAAVSEGISYGMLITVIMSGYDSSARMYFDGLFKFARNNPAYNVDPNLMDWRVNYNCTSAGDGWNAMDGDLDIAMALLMADRQWGSAGAINYKAEAIKTINAIKAKNMNSLGYTMGGPAADLSRTSDYMITHFRSFRKATGDMFWDTAINKSFELMSLMQSKYAASTGLIPDFIAGLPGNPYPSPGGRIESMTEGFFAWNACRIPFRLAADYVTSGDTRSRDIAAKLMDFLNNKTGGDSSLIAMGYKLDGTALSNTPGYTSPSFAGPALAGAMIDGRFQPFMNNLWTLNSTKPATGYYDFELQLLSMIIATGNWWNP